MSNWLNDLRYALRQLRKSPGFTVIAVLTLAVGIGATTAIFTLVDHVLLRPLPYPQSNRMVVIQEQVAQWRDLYPTLPVNANHLGVWQRNSHSFSAIAAMRTSSIPFDSEGKPVRIGVLWATASFFPVFQVTPRIGHAFRTPEEGATHKNQIILMNGLWRSQFHSDPAILGKTVRLGGWPYTVVGVMPASFHLPPAMSTSVSSRSGRAPRVIIPLSFSHQQIRQAMGEFNYFSVGRLKPGVSVAQAADEINALEHTIASRLPAGEAATLSAVLTPFREYLVGSSQKSVTILLIAVGGLLLIGCINIANLLLARFTNRRGELALRMAFGASRLRVTATATMEALVLAVCGGALGIAAAAAAMPFLQRYVPAELNFSGPMQIDWTGAGCAFVLILLATVLSGLLPAWFASGTEPQEALHSESRLATDSRQGNRLRKLLVGAEAALAVALLILTGLLTASMVHLLHVHRGFDADNVLTAKVLLPSKSYPDQKTQAAFYRELTAKLQTMPGAKAAAVVSVLPLDGNAWGDAVVPVGNKRPFAQQPQGYYRWISPGYFSALQLPLVRGRRLSSDDFGHPYALISQKTAKAVWPGQNPIGRQFHRGDPNEAPFTVIGVVADAHTLSLNAPDPMLVYVPYWYRSSETAGVVVRTALAPLTMADTLRKTVWSLNPQVAVSNIRTMNNVVAGSVAQRRFEMQLLALFALCALLLAGLGVYGVVTYSVVRRMREMAIRLALGAQPGSIYRLVLWGALAPVLAGALAGIAIAFAAGRLIASLLFGVSPYDPAIALAAAGVLVCAGAIACLAPARRAASADPMQALRSE